MTTVKAWHVLHIALLDDRRFQVSWVLIGVLLFLRFGLLTVGAFVLPSEKALLSAIFETGTYLFTAGLILLHRRRLSDFNLDGFAVWLVILAKPTETVLLVGMGASSSPMALLHWGGLLTCACSVALLLGLILLQPDALRIRARSPIWWIAGAGCGVVLAAALAYPMSLQFPRPVQAFVFQLREFLRQTLVFGFIYQTGYAAVSEEPFFRGFLWGHLRRMGLSEVWTWLLIAASFVMAHAYYVQGHLISLFVIVPAGAICVGFIAWKAKSISASIGLHGMLNSLGSLFGYIVAWLWG